MPTETHEEAAADLDRLLDEEQAALLAGDLERVAELADEKERIARVLSSGDCEGPGGLELLDAKLRRNQHLLQSALMGIRSVADRMAEMRRVRRGLETYDATGRKSRKGDMTRRALEKRA